MSASAGVPQKRNPDGSVNVHCIICTHKISKMPYQGFSSAICYYCANGIARPAEDPLEQDPALYNEMHDISRDKDGFVMRVIKALAFRRPRQKVKATGSVAVSKEKKRRPLFEDEDDRQKGKTE